MVPVNVNHIINDELIYALLLMTPSHLAIMKMVLHCEEGESISIVRHNAVTCVVAKATDGKTNALVLDITEKQIKQFIADDQSETNAFAFLSNHKTH